MGSCSSGPCNCPSQNQSFKSCLFPTCSETNGERLPGLRMMEAIGPRCFSNGAPGRPAHAFWLGFTGRRNCLPAVGYKLQTDRGMITVRAKDLLVPFHALDFDYAGKQAYVYFCLWQDGLKSREQLRIRSAGCYLPNSVSLCRDIVDRLRLQAVMRNKHPFSCP
jgi:hypothetical protein